MEVNDESTFRLAQSGKTERCRQMIEALSWSRAAYTLHWRKFWYRSILGVHVFLSQAFLGFAYFGRFSSLSFSALRRFPCSDMFRG